MAYITSTFDDEVVRILKNGGAGLVPSDTIYGLSCVALNWAAVEKLQKLKRREPSKPFIILISDIAQLNDLGIVDASHKEIFRYWPGKLTVIFNAPNSPEWFSNGELTLAVRYPDYPELGELIKKTGPLVSTSANLSGGQPAESADEAHSYFGDSLDFYIDAGRISGNPSTIVRSVSAKLKVVRQGDVNIKEEDLA